MYFVHAIYREDSYDKEVKSKDAFARSRYKCTYMYKEIKYLMKENTCAYAATPILLKIIRHV